MTQLLSNPVSSARSSADLFAPIAQDLEQVECVLARSLQHAHPGTAALVTHIGQYRGKRLRPAVLLLIARACGRLTGAHHTLGAVVELIHTATLVHDDVLDGAALRRHVSTVNAGWGNLTSVLLGDYLFTHAFHLCAGLGDARACEVVGEATNRTCEGELRQSLERGNLALEESEYLEMIRGKTAELIACCCRLGAMFSGAAPDLVEGVARFGLNLGIAFQIADDLLDLVGEERATGKSLGTDVEQQKMTLPLIHLLRHTPTSQAGRLRQLLAAPGNHKRDALRPYLAATDSLAYAQRRADEYVHAARAALSGLPASPCRSLLEQVCECVVRRDR